MKRCPKRDIEIIRSWADGQYVFVQALQNINDGEAMWVTTDFFDTDDKDRMIEHWDVISAFTGAGAGGRTAIDGPTEITDLDKTDSNKALVRNLIENALMPGGNPDVVDELVHEDYIQHNKEVPDGRAAFKQLASAPNRPLNYHEIVLLVGQGNFVATLSRARWTDEHLDQEYAQVDIFRLEDDKIVEHWDNVEPVPEISVNSGKF